VDEAEVAATRQEFLETACNLDVSEPDWLQKLTEIVVRTWGPTPFGCGSRSPAPSALADRSAAVSPPESNVSLPLAFQRIVLSPPALSERERSLYQHLSSHLASAYRCRRRQRGDSSAPGVVEGWVAPSHQDGKQPARWTLVDSFTRSGARYIVAREDQSAAPGVETLSERERQIVLSLGIGKTAKETAYDLGLSYNTVRVFLGRARLKLHVNTTEELLALPIVHALCGRAPS
jgi:DNA-binding CsgD family transcriptional regulator